MQRRYDMAVWVGVALAAALWLPAGPAAAQVMATKLTPDGLTATTTVTPPTGGGASGTFEITNPTISGTTGFHSFTDFDVKKDDIVNLIFPNMTTKLVNLVRQKIQIDGKVQGLKVDATLGGMLVFASPQGIDVGASGTINAGSVVLAAPTLQVIDNILGDFTKAQDLIVGNIDLAPTATINIDGTINGAYGISIFANEVIIGGRLRSGKFIGYEDLITGYPDLVKTAVNLDLVIGTGIKVLADGSIEITAGGSVFTNRDVDLTWELSNRARTGESQRRIELTSRTVPSACESLPRS